MTTPDTQDLLAPAYAAFQRNDAALAWQLAQHAVEASPDRFETQMFAGTAALSAGEPQSALEHFGRAMRQSPDGGVQAAVWLGIGRCRIELDESLSAYRAFQRGLALAPRHPGLRVGLASALLGLSRFEDAENAAREVLAENPRNARAEKILGIALMKQNRLNEARQILRRLSDDPGSGWEVRQHLTTLRKIAGDFDGARAELEFLLDTDSPPPVYQQWAQLVSFGGRQDPAFMRLVARERDMGTLGPADRVDALYALAKACDDIGDFDRAGRYLKEANELEASRKPCDPAEDEALMSRIAELFTKPFIAEYETLGPAGIQPIFIVSMPRSGSTLMEQMISAHSAVNGGGEMGHLAQIATALSLKWGADPDFPKIAPETAARDLHRAANQYRDKTARLRLFHSRFTDKSLLNFLYIGLIRMLLPDARIVHIRRHPLATALGLYRQHFARGLRYSYDLETISRYYRSYARLMRHWRRVAPEAFVEVRYEDLVENPDTQLRRVLAYLGLEFEPQCLKFYQSNRPVQTASQVQVRRPLDRAGIVRHQHYAELLAPVARALRDDVAAYEAELSATRPVSPGAMASRSNP